MIKRYLNDQGGVIPILILVSAVGLILFFIISQTADFRDGVFKYLFPKPASHAASNYYGNTVNTLGLFGQKEIGGATRQLVNNTAAYHGAGVTVDAQNRVYYVDSGNNRILGFADGSGTNKPADIVIGQPDMNHGNCNGDDNLGYKKAPTATTLCLLGYPVSNNTAEQWGAINITTDSQGNLFVPDRYNNRVLEYFQPFSTDKTNGKGDGVADFVYGQADFTSNGPNFGDNAQAHQNPGIISAPTNSSLDLCCGYSAPTAVGVAIDPFNDSLWVADTYNGRVMHFAQGVKTADVILATKACDFTLTNLSVMCNPIALGINPSNHELYVIDNWNGFNARFLVFTPDSNGHFSTGQAASRYFKPNEPHQAGVNDNMFDSNGYIFKATGFLFNKDKTDYPNGLIWLNEHERARSLLLDANGNILQTLFAKDVYHNGSDQAYAGCPTNIYTGNKVFWPNGSIGQDSNNKLYFASEYQYSSGKVTRYPLPYSNFTSNGTVCPPDGDASLLQPGWDVASNDTLGEAYGLTVYGNQLIVQDQNNRRLVWNDYTSKPVGAPADYVLTGEMAGNNFLSASIDDQGRMWTFDRQGMITIYQLPFTGNNAPIAQAVPLYWADDQTQVSYFDPGSTMAFDKINKKMYLVDSSGSRILRVSNYNNFATGKLLVDMVIGATSKGRSVCNQGLSTPNAGTLCQTTQIKFDQLGNLYVVDDAPECHGNRRITVFTASDLAGATGLFPNLQAKLVFNEPDFLTVSNCSYWVTNAPGTPISIAFNSKNQLVIGNDGYYGDNSQRELKQLWFYADPLHKQTPDASINLYVGTPGEVAFDDSDNLLVRDSTWYRTTMINICTDPQWLKWLPGVTPVSACATGGANSTPVPSPTMVLDPAPPTATPTPLPTPTPTIAPTPTPTPTLVPTPTSTPISAGDTTPPTAPTNLVGSAISSSQINISWGVSSDNFGVTAYNIFRNGVKITTVSGSVLSYGDANLSANTQYSYYVTASDQAGNQSSPSNTASITTQPAPTPVPQAVGNLSGVVSSDRGGTIPGVKVSLTYNGSKHTFTTTSSGSYSIINIPIGTYSVAYQVPGYKNQTQTVTINTNQTTTENVTLVKAGK